MFTFAIRKKAQAHDDKTSNDPAPLSLSLVTTLRASLLHHQDLQQGDLADHYAYRMHQVDLSSQAILSGEWGNRAYCPSIYMRSL